MGGIDGERRVIVIGTGPTGAMAALTHLRRGIPVTLLDSGQSLPRGMLIRAMGHTLYRRKPHFADQQRHVSSDHPDALWHHDLVPGGMSNYWTGAVPRFAPQDFIEGERLHERYRWPVSYDELVPYYEQIERLLFVMGDPKDCPTMPAPHVAKRYDLPGDWRHVAPHAALHGQCLLPTPLAQGRDWIVQRHSHAFNSFTCIVEQLKRFDHFQLILGAHVLRLEWDGAKKRVRSLVYRDRATGSEQRVNGASFVVAAGPLGSAKLLLDSACADFPDGLGNTEGILGKYLIDHLHNWSLFELDKPLPRLGHTACLTRAPYNESAPLLAAQCTIASVTRLDRALALLPTKTHRFSVVTFGTMIPTERNFVALDPTLKDQFGQSKLDLHIRYDDAEQRNVEVARERVSSMFESAGYRCLFRNDATPSIPGWAIHYGGTVRMHASPKYGMLNEWNRLHSVDNVAVVDASSFTTGVEKNPTLTAMALAARAADRMAADLKAS